MLDPTTMDRHNRQGPDAPKAPANGRSGLPVYNSRWSSNRKFKSRRDADDDVTSSSDLSHPRARPRASPSPSTSSSSDGRVGSPLMPASLIPRPASSLGRPNSRRSLALSEALRMAEEEEKLPPGAGSPSPGPRPWRSNGLRDGNGIQDIFNQQPLDLGRRRSSRQSAGSGRDDESLLSVGSGDGGRQTADREPFQHERDRERMDDVIRGGNSLFSKTRVGPKVAEAGKELSRKASNSSLNGSTPSRIPQRSWGALGRPDPDFAKRLMGSSPDSAGSGVAAPDIGRSASRAVRVDKDAAIPSIEIPSPPLSPSPPDLRPETAPAPAANTHSPNKSFAWQADADFTASDLQVSASPPVKLQRKKSYLEELKEFVPRQNTKLDEIRRREIEAAKKFPDEPEAPEEGAGPDYGSIGENMVDNGRNFAKNGLVGRTNTKIDEIRAREIASLSRRALATARLDEIRERNSEPRSVSPDVMRKPSKELLVEAAQQVAVPVEERVPGRTIPEAKEEDEQEGEQIPDTPVVVFRSTSGKHGRKLSSADVEVETGKDDKEGLDSRRGSLHHSREDSQDLLRKLARAASHSPSPSLEQQTCKSGQGKEAQAKSEAETAETIETAPLPDDGVLAEVQQQAEQKKEKVGGSSFKKAPEAPQFRAADDAAKGPRLRPAALRRAASSDSDGLSNKSKRSSMANSDSDPTDRITAEMMLFAPQDTHSEWGSTRAPSPGEPEEEGQEGGEEGDVEETPRAVRRDDPLIMPTPRVVGAYMETPATVKASESVDAAVERQKGQLPAALSAASLFRNRGRPNRSALPGRTSEDSVTGRSTSVATGGRVRRARSLPRARSPLINSVKLPSAKDDLMEIQRLHQVDDSTLDDFDGLLVSHDADGAFDSGVALLDPMKETFAAAPVSEKPIEKAAARGKVEHEAEEEEDLKSIDEFLHSHRRDFPDRKLDAKEELAAYDRMSRSLKTGLLGIQTAKKGIERLEDRVSSQTESMAAAAAAAGGRTKPSKPTHRHSHPGEQEQHTYGPAADGCPICAEQQKKQQQQQPKEAVTYVHLALPRLWRTRPHPRPTLLGWMVLLLAAWWAAESAMCARFCRPTTCGPGEDCAWSPSDPFFGSAIPVKLDQWLSGGKGRQLASTAMDGIGDLAAEARDLLAGRDVRDADWAALDFEGRRRLGRRLRRKGLARGWEVGEDLWGSVEEWRRAREERERVEGLREMGYGLPAAGEGRGGYGDGERIGADERVR